MLRLSVFRLVMAAVAAVSVCAGTVRADVITQTVAIVGDGVAPQPTYALTDYLQSLTFNKFNVVDGVLDSVTITLSTEAQSAGTFTNNMRSPANVSITATVNTSLSTTDAPISALIGSLVTSNTGTATATLAGRNPGPPLGPPVTQNYNVAHSSDSVTDTFSLPGQVAAFVGAGTFTFDAAGNANVVYNGPANTSVTNSTLAYASVTIVYNYHLNPDPGVRVPEPSSMALAALGSLGLLVVRARRRAV